MDKEKILVTRSSLPPMDEYIAEISDIWESHWLTNMGSKHIEFQERLQNYLEVDNIELLVNGHMALELSLQALGLTEGEVITTPFTFASTTHAIVRNGLTPVFCDINIDDYTIDVSKIEKLITDRTVAIMPVHVYGNICDIEAIQEIADKHNLKVIYDAAHCFGEKYNGVGIGNFGDVSCFSFHATKVFNSIEGGAVCYRDPEIGRKIYQLKNFGIKDQETVDGIGANAKMNEFCAAMGLCNLKHVDEEIQKRRVIYERYIGNLKYVNGIRLNYYNSKTNSNYAYFPLIIDEKEFGHSRDGLYEELLQNNIVARKYFYPLTNAFDCYKDAFDAKLTPEALSISKQVLTLPMHASLSCEQIDYISKVIIDFSFR